MYKFFTDLETANAMDDKPFMVFDFEQVEDALIPELKKLCNDCFDVDTALNAARDLKYLREIKRLIAESMKQPSDELVRYYAKQVYTKPITAKMLETFTEILITAFDHHVNDVINTRLQKAMQTSLYPSQKQVEEKVAGERVEDRIVTTEEEREGYHIIKAILRECIDPARVVMRDTLSYCGVLLDDNNRKPLCRLHFNSSTVKYLELFGEDRKGIKHKIESLHDIYAHSEVLKESALKYDTPLEGK